MDACIHQSRNPPNRSSMKPYSFATRRILWSRFVITVFIVYVALSAPPKLPASWLADVLELTGFVLVSITALGRVWCLTYLGGVKNQTLVTDGPYSVVRNPLYVLNFVGAVGLGLVVENPFLSLILGLLFATFYPAVVKREEAQLELRYARQFAEYCARTPRWLPNWQAYREPGSLTIVPGRVRQAFLDAMWFLWAFGLWEALEETREVGLLLPLF